MRERAPIFEHVSDHVLKQAFEREFPPLEQKKVGQLWAAFRRDENSVFGRILLRILTPNGENSIVNFGSDWRCVIDIKKGLVTAIAPDQEIRNANGKQWRWDEISELVLDEDLIPEKIAAWRQKRKEARVQKKTKEVQKEPIFMGSVETELFVSQESFVGPLENSSDFVEKETDEIGIEILSFLESYYIPSENYWVPTDEILENFKEYRKEAVLDALELLHDSYSDIKRSPVKKKNLLPTHESTLKARWRYLPEVN
jgi:hypothetical protein